MKLHSEYRSFISAHISITLASVTSRMIFVTNSSFNCILFSTTLEEQSVTSPVAQKLRIPLTMQGTLDWYLVWKIPHAMGSTVLSLSPRALAPQQERPQQGEAHTLQLEKACMQQQRPSKAKNKLTNKILKKGEEQWGLGEVSLL